MCSFSVRLSTAASGQEPLSPLPATARWRPEHQHPLGSKFPERGAGSLPRQRHRDTRFFLGSCPQGTSWIKAEFRKLLPVAFDFKNPNERQTSCGGWGPLARHLEMISEGHRSQSCHEGPHTGHLGVGPESAVSKCNQPLSGAISSAPGSAPAAGVSVTHPQSASPQHTARQRANRPGPRTLN